MTKTARIQFASLQMDGDTQSRVVIDQRTVEEYQEAIRNGDKFPPLDVFHDGEKWWLADGYHRVAALKAEGKKAHEVIVHQGGQRAAILWAVGANGKHGLRRSNDDKRKAVKTLLADEEWSKWTNREIARRADVDESTVRKYREESVAGIPQQRIGADGKTYDASKHAATGKTTDQPSTPKTDDLVKTRADLVPAKWYPTNQLTKKILFDAFDSAAAVRSDDRYKLVHVPTAGFMLKDHIQYRDYQVIPGLPKAAPKAEVATAATNVSAAASAQAAPVEQPAPSRTYPTSVVGNMIDDMYYPAVMKLANVHDEAFPDRLSCLNSERYPGNRPILGVSLNHQAFYRTFRLVAPAPSGLASTTAIELPAPGAPVMAGGDIPKTVDPAAAPESQMIYEPNDRFGSHVSSAQEQLELDADYWAEAARNGDLPTSTEPTRYQFDPERFYPVDDNHKVIYHDPRLAAETIHAPYRAVIGSDLNHAPAFESYRLLDADLPAPTIPASAKPPVEPSKPAQAAPAPAQPATSKRVEDDKFYILDKQRFTIGSQAYKSLHEAHLNITSPFYYVESGEAINNLIKYERWTIIIPAAAPNGNGAAPTTPKPNGTPTPPSGTPFMQRSNNGDGKDTPRSAWEARGIANGQAARLSWQNALDFRILVETNLVEVDEELLKRCTKPLKALVIEFLNLGAGKIDEAAFGKTIRTSVSAVSKKPVKAAEPAR